MNGPRIGSLFTGTGALDLAVMDVYGGHTLWHSQYEPPDKNGKEDKNQYAAKILARHWPNVPNLGDITKVDWQQVLDEHGPIDILTGGFPCQDVSSAGKRAGLTTDSRSGLWTHMARAIRAIQPQLVVIENVEGLLSTQASGDMEPCPHCVGDGPTEPSLRALGAVLGDLASLGFDAEWARVAASEVGAAHGRKRVFIYAWPAAIDTGGFGWGDGSRVVGGLGAAGRDAEAPADSAHLGHERGGSARRRGNGSSDGSVVAADAGGAGLEVGGIEPHRYELPAAERSGSEPAADAGGSGQREDILDLRPGQPDLDWGDYGPAIRRWERILGRPAPWPTDALGRLSPVFTEWLMGLPDGWVVDTPGLTRPAMLRALGNGVVRLQAAVAIRHLHQRAGIPLPAPHRLAPAA